MEIVFLGTGAANGVPMFSCRCKACREAIEDPRCRRTRSAIVVKGRENILFDAPPELSAQLLREEVSNVDVLFLTHPHNDHLAGLGDIEIYARFVRDVPLSAYMNRKTLDEVELRFGDVRDWLDVTLVAPGQQIPLKEVTVTALEASHSPGTLGFLLDYRGTRTAYFPDTGPFPKDTRERLFSIDRLILDGTFWGENWYPEEHFTVDEAIAEARSLDVGIMILTHLSMHYDSSVTSAELEEKLKPFGGRVSLAYDGMRLDLAGSRVERAS